MPRRWALFVVAAAGTIATLTHAQEPRPRAPIFPSMAERVLVDVVVTDKNGEPVIDLVAADFEVFEDGIRRQTLSFAAFGVAATRARRKEVGASDPAALPFVLSASVLLIDDGHMSPQEAARLGPVLTEVLRGLYERRGSLLLLAPLSKVSVVGRLPEDAAVLARAAGSIRGQRFPQASTFPMTDAEALDIEGGDTTAKKRLVNRFVALNPTLTGQVEEIVLMRASEVADETRKRREDTFGALRAAFSWLAAQPGRHSLLLLTPGFPHEPGEAGFRRLITSSFESLAPIHFLDVRALAPFGEFQGIQQREALPIDGRVSPYDAQDGAAGSELLANETGGLSVRGLDLSHGLKRILDTTRTYYVLGYEPLQHKKPGFRKIKVKVNRKGVEVLARRGYLDEPKGDTQTAAPEKRPLR